VGSEYIKLIHFLKLSPSVSVLHIIGALWLVKLDKLNLVRDYINSSVITYSSFGDQMQAKLMNI